MNAYLPKSRSGCASSRHGLTLFELLVVMTILAILVSLVIGLGQHADVIAKRHLAIADLGKWQEALHQYYGALGEYPGVQYNGSVTNLLNLSVTIGGSNVVWFGAESSTQLNPIDPWGNPYWYDAATNDHPQSFDNIYSFGRDQTKGTSDDIRFQP